MRDPILCQTHARAAEELRAQRAEIYRHAGSIGPNLSRLDRHDVAERWHKAEVAACSDCQDMTICQGRRTVPTVTALDVVAASAGRLPPDLYARRGGALAVTRQLVEAALELAEYDQRVGAMDSGYVLRRGAMWRAAADFLGWHPDEQAGPGDDPAERTGG